MKIIFDSDEQKEQFQKIVMGAMEAQYCPSSLYLKEHCTGILNLENLDEYTRDCVSCWQNCGIEMEVANGSDKV